ncbi:MAG: preprotein translocase subunit YajC [Actinobacteria bacterium]|nr:preprotein translocase subunit YajC [Actinomycetota bacterium]
MNSLSILAAEQSGGSSVVSLLVLMLIPLAMYFLLIRPQKRRQREAVALQKAIEVGDEVMTTSGIYGFVTGFDGDVAWLEIDDNVQIRIARQGIQRKVDTAAGDTAVPNATGSGSAGQSRHTKISGPAADAATDE